MFFVGLIVLLMQFSCTVSIKRNFQDVEYNSSVKVLDKDTKGFIKIDEQTFQARGTFWTGRAHNFELTRLKIIGTQLNRQNIFNSSSIDQFIPEINHKGFVFSGGISFPSYIHCLPSQTCRITLDYIDSQWQLTNRTWSNDTSADTDSILWQANSHRTRVSLEFSGNVTATVWVNNVQWWDDRIRCENSDGAEVIEGVEFESGPLLNHIKPLSLGPVALIGLDTIL